MSSEDFELVNQTVFDSSFRTRVFSKIHHQQWVNLKDSGKIIDFIFG